MDRKLTEKRSGVSAGFAGTDGEAQRHAVFGG